MTLRFYYSHTPLLTGTAYFFLSLSQNIFVKKIWVNIVANHHCLEMTQKTLRSRMLTFLSKMSQEPQNKFNFSCSAITTASSRIFTKFF